MKSLVVIFNRSALQSTDGWIHIVPKGELPNREAGIVQVLDDAALDSILAGITQDQERLGDKWPGIYGGREHFIYHPDQDSAALAWFKDFQKRDDGIWARDDGLTNIGSEAVKNRLYKFTSFVANRGDLKKITGPSDAGLPRYRVLKIESVGFTNQANGKELLTPITNRCEALAAGAAEVAGAAPAADPAAAVEKVLPPAGLIPEISRLLNLPADTDDDDVLSELGRLQNRLTALQAENQALLGEQVDDILAGHKITDAKVINRLKPILTPLASRAERVAFLGELGIRPETPAAREVRVLNRGGGRAVAAGPGHVAPDDDRLLTRKIQNRAGELQATGLKFDTAWKQAQQEILNAG